MYQLVNSENEFLLSKKTILSDTSVTQSAQLKFPVLIVRTMNSTELLFLTLSLSNNRLYVDFSL